MVMKAEDSGQLGIMKKVNANYMDREIVYLLHYS